MTNFFNAMHNTYLDSGDNLTHTENGALAYRSTGKELLDLNFAVASLRSAVLEEIHIRFSKAYHENPELAIKWLFFARDIRGGLGERRLFRECLWVIANEDPDLLKRLIPLIPEYGRWDDLWVLLPDLRFREDIISLVNVQISRDYAGIAANKPITLLAKWLPSANASSEQTKGYARVIYRGLGWTERKYRKILSTLRRYLDVVERKMSSNEWQDVQYETVPSRANLIYKDAFMRHDAIRRTDYLMALEKGETKINSGVLYPHDIVHAYHDTYIVKIRDDAALEAMWKALPDMVNGDGSTMVVADGSGSMTAQIGKTTVTALDVANALAIYFAERANGPYHNRYITFSSHPQFVRFDDHMSLRDKIDVAEKHDECANTNIEAVFDLILETAVQNRLHQNEIPANVLIISDMEFDSCAEYPSGEMNDFWGRRCTRYAPANATLFRIIAMKYERAGYKLPRLVFWNVNSRTGAIPVRENEMGVALVSGFSVNICKMVMSGKTDPFECLLETLNSERYQPVEKAFKGL